MANAAFGDEALRNNVSGQRNTAIGHATLVENSAGSFNTIVGADAAYSLTGSENTAIGANALQGQTSGAGNTGVGYKAGIVSGGSIYTYSTFLGNNARPQSNNFTNATAIGYNSIVTASDAIQLGNTSVTNVKTSGTITAGNVTYPNNHNSTAGQVLTTNASGIASWATPSIPLATAIEGFNVTLSSAQNGYIIYAQNAGWPNFPTNLPDGFQCTIVNYSTYTWSSNTLSGLFYLKTTNNGTPGSNNTFTILPGGTAIVNVVTIQGAKRYYIMN